jgi:hypothetical protein
MDMVAASKTSLAVTNFKLAVSAAKYMTADLGAATGTSLAPFGQNEIRQVNLALMVVRDLSEHPARPKGGSPKAEGQVRPERCE